MLELAVLEGLVVQLAPDSEDGMDQRSGLERCLRRREMVLGQEERLYLLKVDFGVPGVVSEGIEIRKAAEGKGGRGVWE